MNNNRATPPGEHFDETTAYDRVRNKAGDMATSGGSGAGNVQVCDNGACGGA